MDPDSLHTSMYVLSNYKNVHILYKDMFLSKHMYMYIYTCVYI